MDILKWVMGLLGQQSSAPSSGVAHPMSPEEANRYRIGPTATPTPTPMPMTTPAPVPTNSPVRYGRNPVVQGMAINPLVEDALIRAATTYKMKPDILYDIGFGESSLNPNPPVITDQYGREHKGLFQFDQNTIDTVNRYASAPNSTMMTVTDFADPYQSASAAAYLISHGQLGRWEASKPSWGKYYSEDELRPYYSQTLGYRQNR